MPETILIQQIEQRLTEKLGLKICDSAITPVSGGCINECYRFKSDIYSFFVKLNSAAKYPGMFAAEAKGLNLLKAANAIFVPQVLDAGEVEEQSYLMLEYIEPGKRIPCFFEEFGHAMALLHRNTATSFGLDHDNYIGSLPQSNKQYDNWSDFFVEERLEKQVKLAKDKKKLDSVTVRRFDRLYAKSEQLFPHEPPALLHGDIWNGNYMTAPDGKACIFDPAVYYGHREMDIAMTKLFGGFADEFYRAYNSCYPLEKGWEERQDIANLYPLMVHVNLFGGNYLMDVKKILNRF